MALIQGDGVSGSASCTRLGWGSFFGAAGDPEIVGSLSGGGGEAKSMMSSKASGDIDLASGSAATNVTGFHLDPEDDGGPAAGGVPAAEGVCCGGAGEPLLAPEPPLLLAPRSSLTLWGGGDLESRVRLR